MTIHKNRKNDVICRKKKGRRKEGNEMGEIEKKKGGERNDKEWIRMKRGGRGEGKQGKYSGDYLKLGMFKEVE
jgi:hypothetical protein